MIGYILIGLLILISLWTLSYAAFYEDNDVRVFGCLIALFPFANFPLLITVIFATNWEERVMRKRRKEFITNLTFPNFQTRSGESKQEIRDSRENLKREIERLKKEHDKTVEDIKSADMKKT